MPSRVWRTVGNLPATVDPLNNAALNPAGVGNRPPWGFNRTGGFTNSLTIAGMWAYSGACWMEALLALVRFGGGHLDWAGNPLLALPLGSSSPAYELWAPPSGCVGSNTVLPLDDLLESTNVYSGCKWPRSTHSYDLLQPRGEQLLVVQPGAAFVDPGRASNPGLFGWTRQKGWENIAQGSANTPGNGTGNASLTSCYDHRRDQLFVYRNASGPIEYFNFATRTKVLAPGGSTSGIVGAKYTNFTTDARTIYAPELDVQIQLHAGYPGHLGIYDYGRTLNNEGGFGFDQINKPGATGTPPSYTYNTFGGFSPNGVWVPGYGPGGWGSAVGCVLCWHGGTSLHMLTPPPSGNVASTPWAWSVLTADPSNTVNPGVPFDNRMFGSVFYSPTLCAIGVQNGPTQLLKLFDLR